MQLTFILKTRAACWANLAVMTSIDRMAPHFGDYFYPELADTVKYISMDIFICIIKEQCSEQEESKWKRSKGCQINLYDGLCQIKWLYIVDTPVAKWASMERQRFFVMYLESSGGRLVANVHKRSLGSLYRQKWMWNAPCPIMKMSVNRVSTIVSHKLWFITVRCGGYCLCTWFGLFRYTTRLTNT